VPIVQTRYTAYMKAERCPRQISVDELAQRRVSYPRGIRAIELMLPAERLIGVTRYADSIRQLELGIADAMLGVELEVDLTLTRQGNRSICKIAEPLVRLELYHGLHRRHAAIVPRLEQALGALQRSGEMARIWAAEEKKLRDAAPPVP
jgi:polar amino acid transport system substrate-binding protein